MRVPFLQWRAGQLPGQTHSLQRFPSQLIPPSMEGRAIARPNAGGAGGLPVGRWPAFNGGPGNCPAKPADEKDEMRHRLVPSMEGRAIARPNHEESGLG